MSPPRPPNADDPSRGEQVSESRLELLGHLGELAGKADSTPPDSAIEFGDDEPTTLTRVPSQGPAAGKAVIGGMLTLEPQHRPRAWREVILAAAGLILATLLLAAAVIAYAIHKGHIPGFLQ